MRFPSTSSVIPVTSLRLTAGVNTSAGPRIVTAGAGGNLWFADQGTKAICGTPGTAKVASAQTGVVAP
jgi:streptogramin lyase